MPVVIIVVVCHCILQTPVVLATGRIIGGTEVSIKNFPYQVGLETFKNNFCSGTIVAVNKILTAAHCIKNILFFVRYGSDTILRGGKLVRVAHIILHPLYVNGYNDYDVAVLTLEKHLQFNERCASVPLSKNTKGGNRTCWVSGWGFLKNDIKPKKLHAVKVKEVSYKKCKTAWWGRLSNRMICFNDVGKDSCQGDSGGPLVDKAKYELVGITSWGGRCADPLYPGVYTNVAVLYNWIVKEINTNRVGLPAKSSANKIRFFVLFFIKTA